MRKIQLAALLCLFFVAAFSQQNVGIGTNAPTSKLDVQGGISLREGTALVLSSSSSNDNIALPGNYSFYRITGPTGAFTITGLIPATGADGEVVTLVNTTAFAMTIKNNAVSTSTNQITTLTGGDVTSLAGNSSLTLHYNKTAGKWYITSTQNFTVAPGSIATSNTLGSATNTMTSTVDGVSSNAPIVNSVVNSSSTNTLTTTVNGVTGSGVNIINSHTLTENGSNQLSSTVNGVTAGPVTLNISGDVGGNLGASTVSKINGAALGTTTGAATGEVLQWNGSLWVPSAAAVPTGSGTSNYLARWTSSTALGTGASYDNGSALSINTISAPGALSVNGTAVIGAALTSRSALGLTISSNSTAAYAANTDIGDGNRQFSVVNEGSTANEMTTLSMRSNSSGGTNNQMLDMKLVNPNDGTSKLIYSFGPNGSFADRFTFTSAGNLGIGTISPQAELHVLNGRTYLDQLSHNPSSGYANADLVLGDDQSTRDGYGTTNGSHIFLQSNSKSSITALHQGANVGQISYKNLVWTLGENIGWGAQNICMPVLGAGYVKSDASGNLSSSAIASGDIPGGSANYIQNQTAAVQSANYWISGTAQVGSNFTNLGGRLLTSNQSGWQADGVTPQMVISNTTTNTNIAALIGLDLHNDGTTVNTYSPFLCFSRRSNSTSYNSAFAAIGAQATGQGTDANWVAGDLMFSTENGTVNGLGEKMRITSSGNVGIATTTPAYKLDVNGNFRTVAGNLTLFDDYIYVSANNQNTLNSGYNNNSVVDMWLNYRGYNDGFGQYRNLNVGNGEGADIAWFSGATNSMSINNGQVASYNLDVNGTMRSTTSAYFATSSGNVGIHNTDPAAMLTIVQGGTDPSTYSSGKTMYVTGVSNPGTNYDGNIEFRHDNNSQGIGFGYQSIYATGYNATQVLNIYSRGGAALTLNAYGGGGYVGIGTTNPQKPLDVATSGGMRISLTANISDNNELYFQDGGQIRSADDNHRIIFDRPDNIIELREYGNIIFSAGATASARTTSAFVYPGGGTSPYSGTGTVGAYQLYTSYRGYYFYDTKNDLDAIDGIKPLVIKDPETGATKTVNDPKSIPFGIAAKCTVDTDEYNVNVNKMISLSIGAIRELNNKTNTQFEAQNSRIDRLEKLVSQLTGKELGQMDFTASATAYRGMENYVIMDARITPDSKVIINGLSDYKIKAGEGSLEITFVTPPTIDTKFTYSAKF